MRIALNAASFNTNHFETFIEIARLHPGDTFIFIFDTETTSTNLPTNVITVAIMPPAKIPLKWRIWYNLKLPSVLKKNKVDIFISEKFISLKSKIPQILISPDLTFIHRPSLIDKKQISFYKKNTPGFLEKANAIIVNSCFLKKEIEARYKISEEKIQVIYPEVKKLITVSFEEKGLFKEKYAEGNEYFIYKGIASSERNLFNLLKAFSFFKKRQRSKMQLLITGTAGEKFEEFVRSLQSYKFKNEVKVFVELPEPEKQKILSCAYAMVSVPFYESDGEELIEAMKTGVPLIASDITFLKEYCADAALYAKPDSFNDIAEKMMLLFKDEEKRKELIEKGKFQVQKFYDEKQNEKLIELVKKFAPDS